MLDRQPFPTNCKTQSRWRPRRSTTTQSLTSRPLAPQAQAQAGIGLGQTSYHSSKPTFQPRRSTHGRLIGLHLHLRHHRRSHLFVHTVLRPMNMFHTNLVLRPINMFHTNLGLRIRSAHYLTNTSPGPWPTPRQGFRRPFQLHCRSRGRPEASRRGIDKAVHRARGSTGANISAARRRARATTSPSGRPPAQ